MLCSMEFVESARVTRVEFALFSSFSVTNLVISGVTGTCVFLSKGNYPTQAVTASNQCKQSTQEENTPPTAMKPRRTRKSRPRRLPLWRQHLMLLQVPRLGAAGRLTRVAWLLLLGGMQCMSATTTLMSSWR